MILYVPYSGEPRSLLHRTLESLQDSPVPVVVVDNSHFRTSSLWELTSLPPLTPPAPLTLWQTLWMLCHNDEPFMWTQCDAVIGPLVVPRVLSLVENLTALSRSWGVVFGNHNDFFSAVNAPLLLKRDCLPDLNFPHYHGDFDWYHRMGLAGLEIVCAGGADVIHEHHGHCKGSRPRTTFHECMDSARYYRKKWGGDHGKETYQTPWNA